MNSSRLKKKKRLFSFHKLNKYFLMPFFVPIICFTTKFFSETMKTDGWNKDIKDVTKDNTHTFVFLYQAIQSICLFLGGLLYFISLHKSKSLKRFSDNTSLHSDSNSDCDSESNKTKFKFLKKTDSNSLKSEAQINLRKNLIIIFMPLLIIFYNISIAYGVKHPQLEKRVYFLFFITIINVFFLKKQIFSHHKLSLVITAIGIIPIFLAFGLYLEVDKYFILYDINLFIGSFAYSVYLVFIKYLTNNKEMSVFLLLLYQGILCFIYTNILYIILSLAIKGDLTFIYNVFHCSEENYICISYYYFKIIMYLILNTVLQTLIFLVVYYFSPELFAISDIFSPLLSFISLCIETHETNGVKIFLTCLGYLIIAVGAFIYNELIVCNFCGFNENTWKAIDKKAYEDYSLRDARDSFIIDDYDISDILSNSEGGSFEMDDNNKKNDKNENEE